jgi:hypothetical protein
MPDQPLELWYWIIPGDAYPFTPRQSTWRMTEEEASRRYGMAAEKVEGSLEIRLVSVQTGQGNEVSSAVARAVAP